MLELMRKHAKSWFIKAVLFAVILVFVFWGVGSFKSDRSNRIAMVNDHPITVSEYKKAYESLLQKYRSIYGNELPDDLSQKMNLKGIAMESLIEEVLLLQEAEKLELEVTKEELRQSIVKHPAFQKDGVFIKSLYVRILGFSRMSPEEFEAAQRQDLLVRKITDMVKASAKISEDELLQAYSMQNESANIEFIKIKDASPLGTIKLSEEEVADYFSKHKGEYQIPAKVKLQYLTFDPKDYESKVEISNEDIKNYYEMFEERFTIPEKIKARQIFIKSLKEDGIESIKKAREKGDMILKEIQGGKDFAQLAKMYSDDTSAKSGGDVGTMERDQFVQPLRGIVSSMKAGEVSSVVKGPFGFHIVKLEEVIEPETMPLEKVRPEIVSLLKRERAQELTEDKAESVLERVFYAEGLKEFAADMNLKIHETGLFAKNEKIEGIGSDLSIQDAAFSLNKGEVSEVIKSSGVNYIIHVVEKMSPKIPELSEVRKSVEEDARREKGKNMAKEKGGKLLEGLTAGKETWESIITQKDFKGEETGYFIRGGGNIPKIGYSEDMKEEVFALQESKAYGKNVFEVGGSYFIVRLKDRKGIDKEKYNADKEKFKRMLLEQKKEEVFYAWLQDLKAKAEIKRDLNL